jgi:major vault protein
MMSEAHLCQGQAGEEWLFEGPATYIPQVEVEVVENIQAYVLAPNQALRVTSFYFVS